jgi:hypothetical protein
VKPVFQVGETCWQACLASVLEVRLEDVPVFNEEVEGVSWLQAYRSWLITEHHSTMMDVTLRGIGFLPSGAHCIVCGYRPTATIPHAIVAYCDGDTLKPVHDPTGDNGFDIGEPEQWVITFIWRLAP